MSVLDIEFGDGAAKEFLGRNIIQGQLVKFVGLDDGTEQKNPTVGFFIELSDGRLVFAETTYKLFNAAHAACRGRFGEVT